MSPWRILVVVLGALVGLAGLAVATGGGTLLWADRTQRDAAGFFTTSEERFSAPGSAIVSEQVDLGGGPDPGWFGDAGDHIEIRVRVASADPSDPVFVGIAPADDVERYLDGVAHSRIADVSMEPFRVTYAPVPGTRSAPAPGGLGIWEARASGPGARSLRWPLESGRWVLVIMNADGSEDVTADVSLGVRVDALGGVAVGLLLAGLLAAALGAALVVAAFTRGRGPPAGDGPAPARPGMPAAAEPVRLDGVMEPPPGRWLWLVKWILVIPHLVVLALLWLAFLGLTVAAFASIVATGRYPRGIFGVNVGILRWSWRVGFYAYGALGTDRYPPFSLHRDAYPATLEVTYPEHLSRRLVWVKWWLLAIPHYVLLGIFGTGAWWSAAWAADGGAGWALSGPGLIGALVFIAGLWLLFAGRYPADLFGLVVGLNRWVYRVIAYAALMTDRYPPFRLDAGGSEPAPEPEGADIADAGPPAPPDGH